MCTVYISIDLSVMIDTGIHFDFCNAALYIYMYTICSTFCTSLIVSDELLIFCSELFLFYLYVLYMTFTAFQENEVFY